jgi:hypothetical protein
MARTCKEVDESHLNGVGKEKRFCEQFTKIRASRQTHLGKKNEKGSHLAALLQISSIKADRHKNLKRHP